MDQYGKAIAYLMRQGHKKEDAEKLVKQFPIAAIEWAEQYSFWYQIGGR